LSEDQIVKLAREAIEEYVLHGRRKEEPEPLPSQMERRRGVFVSIKKDGNLRGCIGTTSPTQPNIAQEIISNAISASNHDPRFSPVRPEELDQLQISVDILGEQEPVSSLEELDSDKYGVVVQKDHRSGLLLPDLEGINTAAEQVEIAKKKAGIPARAEVDLYRFEVERHS